jgi:hypothetical protein
MFLKERNKNYEHRVRSLTAHLQACDGRHVPCPRSCWRRAVTRRDVPLLRSHKHDSNRAVGHLNVM